MAPPKSRVRKFHRRSKNGCTTCKQRHVRCDERKPLCTNCLQTGKDCIYPESEPDHDSRAASESVASEAEAPLVNVVSHQPFAGFSGDYQMSPMSQWLWHQCLLHGCLVVAACQWAWVTGSLEHVKVPFLYHKAAAYEFAKQQLSESVETVSDTTVFAIATLALTENGYNLMRSNLAQQMLEMAGDRLRRGEVNVIHDAISADFQPSIIALLFTSLWDMESLPPRQAPRYGWWEGDETPTDRLWQDYTKNLNWELSRGFDPERNIATMLNGDAKSSRASYIATFFYLVMAVNDSEMDCVLTVWLLEQLIDDVCDKEEEMIAGTFSRSLWFWSVLFGAAVANTGRPITATGREQLAKWRAMYAAKLGLASSVMRLDSWQTAKAVLAEVAWTDGSDAEGRLQDIWEDAVVGRGAQDRVLDMSGGGTW
ncbi:C6 transcription factor [Colletotrichum higginsianum]|nr:C6 transcription factor [Colletotrichum higginsianum]